MGDRCSGLYVEDGLVRFFRDRVPGSADIVTPNHFELEILAGRPLPKLTCVLAAADMLRGAGARIVLVSSLITAEQAPDTVATLAATGEGAWLATTPLLPNVPKGTGDLLTALFLARWLAVGDLAAALAQAVSSTFAVIEATAEAGARELRLVAAQNALPAATRAVPVLRLR